MNQKYKSDLKAGRKDSASDPCSTTWWVAKYSDLCATSATEIVVDELTGVRGLCIATKTKKAPLCNAAAVSQPLPSISPSSLTPYLQVHLLQVGSLHCVPDPTLHPHPTSFADCIYLPQHLRLYRNPVEGHAERLPIPCSPWIGKQTVRRKLVVSLHIPHQFRLTSHF